MTTEKDKNDNEDDNREETPEEEYDVEKLLRAKIDYDEEVRKRTYFYFVKWKDYNDDWNTWEPEGNITTEECMEEFWNEAITNSSGERTEGKPNIMLVESDEEFELPECRKFKAKNKRERKKSSLIEENKPSKKQKVNSKKSIIKSQLPSKPGQSIKRVKKAVPHESSDTFTESSDDDDKSHSSFPDNKKSNKNNILTDEEDDDSLVNQQLDSAFEMRTQAEIKQLEKEKDQLISRKKEERRRDEALKERNEDLKRRKDEEESRKRKREDDDEKMRLLNAEKTREVDEKNKQDELKRKEETAKKRESFIIKDKEESKRRMEETKRKMDEDKKRQEEEKQRLDEDRRRQEEMKQKEFEEFMKRKSEGGNAEPRIKKQPAKKIKVDPPAWQIATNATTGKISMYGNIDKEGSITRPTAGVNITNNDKDNQPSQKISQPQKQQPQSQQNQQADAQRPAPRHSLPPPNNARPQPAPRASMPSQPANALKPPLQLPNRGQQPSIPNIPDSQNPKHQRLSDVNNQSIPRKQPDSDIRSSRNPFSESSSRNQREHSPPARHHATATNSIPLGNRRSFGNRQSDLVRQPLPVEAPSSSMRSLIPPPSMPTIVNPPPQQQQASTIDPRLKARQSRESINGLAATQQPRQQLGSSVTNVQTNNKLNETEKVEQEIKKEKPKLKPIPKSCYWRGRFMTQAQNLGEIGIGEDEHQSVHDELNFKSLLSTIPELKVRSFMDVMKLLALKSLEVIQITKLWPSDETKWEKFIKDLVDINKVPILEVNNAYIVFAPSKIPDLRLTFSLPKGNQIFAIMVKGLGRFERQLESVEKYGKIDESPKKVDQRTQSQQQPQPQLENDLNNKQIHQRISHPQHPQQPSAETASSASTTVTTKTVAVSSTNTNNNADTINSTINKDNDNNINNNKIGDNNGVEIRSGDHSSTENKLELLKSYKEKLGFSKTSMERKRVAGQNYRISAPVFLQDEIDMLKELLSTIGCNDIIGNYMEAVKRAPIRFIHVQQIDHVYSMPDIVEARANNNIKFFLFGTYDKIPKELWSVHEIYRCGGIVSFTSSVLSEDIEKVENLVEKFSNSSKDSKTRWNLFILEDVYNEAMKKLTERSLTDKNAESQIRILNNIFKTQYKLMSIRELPKDSNEPIEKERRPFALSLLKRRGTFDGHSITNNFKPTTHKDPDSFLLDEMRRMQYHVNVREFNRRFIIIDNDKSDPTKLNVKAIERHTVDSFSDEISYGVLKL